MLGRGVCFFQMEIYILKIVGFLFGWILCLKIQNKSYSAPGIMQNMHFSFKSVAISSLC